jgi:CYTH domain-containing protein
VNTTAHLEIERKFLVEYPDVDVLDVRRKISIVQTYLSDGDDGAQRRVRSIEENGRSSYTYTEKHFRSPVVRDEYEKEITADEYNELLLQKKTDFTPVEKVRYCFCYKDQLFELDTYHFSSRLAVMELELESEDQVIYLPDNVKVIREVTGEKRYSNSTLANAGCFPEEAPAEKGES